MKLGSGVGKHITNGPVLYYTEDGQWEAICDEGFTDYSAQLVCSDLGFSMGRAILGSAYGKIFEDIMENKTLPCRQDVSYHDSVNNCLRDSPGKCNQSSDYASVVCFDDDNRNKADDYSKYTKFQIRPRVYKTFFILNSAECEICPAELAIVTCHFTNH